MFEKVRTAFLDKQAGQPINRLHSTGRIKTTGAMKYNPQRYIMAHWAVVEKAEICFSGLRALKPRISPESTAYTLFKKSMPSISSRVQAPQGGDIRTEDPPNMNEIKTIDEWLQQTFWRRGELPGSIIPPTPLVTSLTPPVEMGHVFTCGFSFFCP